MRKLVFTILYCRKLWNLVYYLVAGTNNGTSDALAKYFDSHMSLKRKAENFYFGAKNLGMIPSVADDRPTNFPADMPRNPSWNP